jgi:hypothetical protein
MPSAESLDVDNLERGPYLRARTRRLTNSRQRLPDSLNYLIFTLQLEY